MKDLNELVWFLTRHKVKDLKVITNKNIGGNRYNEFYDLLSSERYQSEDEYAHHFGYANAKELMYKRFRKDFKNRLHNATLFVELNEPQFTDATRAFQHCQEKAAVVSVLLSRGATLSAIEIMEQYLPIAIKYSFIELSYNWIKLLRYYYSLAGDKKRHKNYSLLFEKYENILIWENKAMQYYEEVTIQQQNTLSVKKGLTNVCREYFSQLSKQINHIDSVRFEFYTGFIEISSYMLSFDWEKTVEKIDFWNERLISFQGYTVVLQNMLVVNKAVSLTMLNQFPEAKKNIMIALENSPLYSNIWFKCMYTYIYNCMLSTEYEEAWEKTEMVRKNDRFAYEDPMLKEQVEIIHAYLVVLSRLDAFELSSKDKGGFNIGDFLANVPVFSKDKKGLNVTILQLQILLQIAEQDFERAAERIRLLSEYSVRHFPNESEEFRSQVFIVLLKKSKEYNFNIRIIEKKTRLYLTKLTNAPFRDANQNHGIELIRYEQLWQMILDAIRGKYKKQVKKMLRPKRIRIKDKYEI
jgi:hypothetical protein